MPTGFEGGGAESAGVEFELAWPVFLRLVLAGVMGWAVALVHRKSSDVAVPHSFRVTLVLLTILIAGVTQIIGDSVARAFALVGALSIVRFRTVVRDTRDTVYVIFSVTLGMAMGTSHYWTGVIALVVVSCAAFMLKPIPGSESDPYQLLVRVNLGLATEDVLRPVFQRHVKRSSVVRVATVRGGAALETTYDVWLGSASGPQVVIDEINRLEGVQSAELVLSRAEA